MSIFHHRPLITNYTKKKYKERYISMDGVVTHSHGPEGKHAHEDVAFTTWIDFDLATKQAQAIATAFSRSKPSLRETFQENDAALQKDLMALDRDIKSILITDPSTNRNQNGFPRIEKIRR